MTRRLLAVGVLVALILVSGLAVTRLLSDEPTAEPTAFEPARPVKRDAALEQKDEKTAVIETVEGRALRRVPGSPAAPVVRGDRLPVASTVETTGGRVTLTTSGGAQVVVSDDSLLRVAEPQSDGVDIVLARGRAEAQTKGESLTMGFEGSDAVATAEDGDFAAVADGKGQIAVAASRGQVDLRAQGKSVTVREGEQSVVRPSMPPSAPTSIPSSFFLKVRKPGTSRRPQAKLAGRTAPGSIVKIGDKSVVVGANGKFETEVPLSSGQNSVKISARDTQGREAEKNLSIKYQKPDPALRTKVVW